MPKIIGINKTALWQAWKIIRKQLPRASIRDVTDFAEFDIDPDLWIKQLLDEVSTGRYEPATVYRYSTAKKTGFSRQMAHPSIPDLVLFKAAVDFLYTKAKRREKAHVYFTQSELSKKMLQVQEEMDVEDVEYNFTSRNALVAWLMYDQYRKHLLLDKVYDYIVITDISNYFDSILYDRVADTLNQISVDRNLVGLVFFLLENLSYRDAFNESPRIGLPVDEFECSRTLAHMVLFPHDSRMTRLVSEGAYVRWMDDQNFGANSYAEGLKILKECDSSLRRLHLAPNASKSCVLSFKEATRHFHFDSNAALDEIGKMPSKTLVEKRAMRIAAKQAWDTAKQFEPHGGEWSKVLKRFYRFAGICQARFLRSRAKHDILKEPTLTSRIVDYIRVTSTPSFYISFVDDLTNDPAQVYPDVNQLLVEGFLKIEAAGPEANAIRKFSSKLLSKKQYFPGWQRCAALAPLIILRFGDRRSLPIFKKLVSQLHELPHPAIGKAVVAVYASFGKNEYREAMKAASKLKANYLANFLQMLDHSMLYQSVPDRFKIRRSPVFDSVSGKQKLDTRKLLMLRLLRLNQRVAIQKWLDDSISWIEGKELSDFDKRLANKLLAL